MMNFVAVLTAILSTLLSSQSAAPVDDRYNKETPYGNAATSPIKAPPQGYEPIFIETVARHGARSLTSSSAEKRALKVWEDAEEQDALTPVGETLAEDIEEFQEAERKVDYGRLGEIGKLEWAGIGRRTADNYGDYLKEATADSDEIAYTVTSSERTEQSADAMIAGLERVVPDLKLAERIEDKSLKIESGSTDDGDSAIDQILNSQTVVDASKALLRELYAPSFVDELDDPTRNALDIYKLYSTAPGMQGETSVTFEKYVPLEQAKVLAYAADARNFYRFGPGVAGEDSSYRAAEPVLDDFFDELDKRIAGGSTAAVFRLAHGETTMPFAALIGLPGSEKQASKGEVYTYDNNPWRGRVAGGLAGNIEWVAYRNAAKDVLVTMRYNEQPVEFRAGCRAAQPYFYEVAELKRCLR